MVSSYPGTADTTLAIERGDVDGLCGNSLSNWVHAPLYHMGTAVRITAEDARNKIEELARDLGLRPGSNLPLVELRRKKYGMLAGNIIGTGSFIPDDENTIPRPANRPMRRPSGAWAPAGRWLKWIWRRGSSP